jgi:hypothetical protein
MIVVSAADPSSCREFRYQDGKNQLVNTYDDRTLRADSLYAATTAIDEEVWASLAPQKLIAAAENSLGRGWIFGAALLYHQGDRIPPQQRGSTRGPGWPHADQGEGPHTAVVARLRTHDGEQRNEPLGSALQPPLTPPSR